VIHALVIFISAFLIFLVQPLIAKQILPWFGGSAAVWTTCLLFFQSALLAGYGYAHALTRFLPLKRQVQVHSLMLLCALAFMPIIVSDQWRPTGSEDPILQIIMLLIATIGLPYFLLSTTTPLVGAWYWRQYQSEAPYRLFALSNAASLLALIGFPFLIEPIFGNRETAWIWSALFICFALLCIGMAWRTWFAVRGHRAEDSANPSQHHSPATDHGLALTDRVDPVAKGNDHPGSMEGVGQHHGSWASWIGYSAMGSALLLGVSSHLTQNISSAPLLWVLPLALYLVTFIISFDHPRWYKRIIFLPLSAAALPAMAWLADSLDLAFAAPVYSAGLFVLCMVFHGELYRIRPEPQRLTQFYLAMSAGGAIGSLLMAVVAPLVMNGHYEFHIVLILAATLGFVLIGKSGAISAGKSATDQGAQPAFGADTLASTSGDMRASRAWLMLFAAGVLVAVLGFTWKFLEHYNQGVRMMARDFYGVVRTRNSNAGGEDYRNLVHGSIAHGGQLQRDELQMTPSSYFGPDSGYGRTFASLPAGPKRVGVIGLGAGALAVYAKPGDQWVFYEISPAVVKAAQTEFSFLKRMQAPHELVIGDGRLALEREAPRQFDVIAMDAFAGDSIPSHFLTKEAMALYVKHLKPDGAIVFQATNRFVNPMPVIRQLADHFGLHAVLVSDSPDFDSGPQYWLSSTDQVIVTRNPVLFEHERLRSVIQRIDTLPGLKLFTDDYINLLKILKH
jgi:hypothetical protein